MERELGSGGIVATESRGSADVAESDSVKDGVALQDVTFSDISRACPEERWQERVTKGSRSQRLERTGR
jgi:hypothetical protein